MNASVSGTRKEQRMKAIRFAPTLLIAAAVLSGCTHPVAVTNLNNYKPSTLIPLEERLSIGIRATAPDLQGHRLTHAIRRDLAKYNADSIMTDSNATAPLDVIADIAVVPEYKGSGWNFWVDFPGFLIWAPAWHGYNYQANYDIDVRLTDAKTGELINTIYVPVRMKVKHADISRTWTTGAGIPTLGTAPLIGGLVTMNYDETVTPLVNQLADPTIADYVAQQIATKLHYYKSSPSDRIEKLEQLTTSGVITEEEYKTRRQAIINSL